MYPLPFSWRSSKVMAFSEAASSASSTPGYAGFVGAVLLLFAFLSVMWAGLDPSTDLRSWFTLSFELACGLTIAIGFGFKLAQRASLQSEISGVMLGVLGGVIILGLQMALLTADYFLSTAQGVWLSMLAPVAETMLVVAVYHVFRFHFPEISWIQIAIPTDLMFAVFHYFAYGMRPDFILVEIILAIGNTVFVYLYHLTHNATVPMVAHFIVNVAPNSQAIGQFLMDWGLLFMVLFFVFLVFYLYFGGRNR